MGNSPKYDFTDQFGNTNGDFYHKTNRYNYLSIPLKWSFLFTENSKIQLNCGIAPSLLLYGIHIYPDFNNEGERIGNNRITSTSWIKRFDLAGFVEFGTEFRISKNLLINPKVTLRHSVTNLNLLSISSGNKTRHYGLFLGLGFKYNKG